MTSKTIYGCEPFPSPIDNKFHYVYRITNLLENKHYYGVKSSLRSPYLVMGESYFGSPKSKNNMWIVDDQRYNPSHYKYKILCCFKTREEALDFEVFMHKKFDVKSHSKFYNESNQTSSGFDTLGKKQDQRRQYLDINNNIVYLFRNEYENNKGEYRPTFPAKDSNGNMFRITRDDPRFISGELVGNTKGVTQTKETRARIAIAMMGRQVLSTTREILRQQKLGKKKSREEIERMISTKKASKKMAGENNPNHSFYYHTPWGIIIKFDHFSPELTSGRCDYFVNKPDRIISRAVYINCEKLKNTFPEDECIGRTYRELGFYRIPKSDITSYSDSMKLYSRDLYPD